MSTNPLAKQKIVLSIAGSDSGAGAGIQADIKACSALGVHCASVITAITAQNTQGVQAISPLSPDMLSAQLNAVANDFSIGAIKIGMLGTPELLETTCRFLRAHPSVPIVVDPVLKSSSGQALFDNKDSDKETLLKAYLGSLLPLASLVTPNLNEAATLLGQSVANNEQEMAEQARTLVSMNVAAVLLKGGHLSGDQLTDVLVTSDEIHCYRHPRIHSDNTHGTGCNLSSAIAAQLVKGNPLELAVKDAIEFLEQALIHGRDLSLGQGPGPLFAQRPWREH